MARFFIDRPIFAWVIAIAIMIAGGLSLTKLPVSQFPEIAPPGIAVLAQYPGASAETLENTVAQVIEQQMNGIDNLRYMSATSEATGEMRIDLTFEQGTDPDIAQVQVQNKLQLAMPKLPVEVQQQGVQVVKSTVNFLTILAIYSEDGSFSTADLGDLTVSRLQEQLSRVQGVGETFVLGAQYAMRIWLDPHKLNGLGVTASDVKNAIRAQNAQISVGQVGGLPSTANQQIYATVMAQSRLQTPEQFQNILLRTNSDGSVVRLADVARVELGSENYDVEGKYNGKPTVGLFVRMAPGANALDTKRAIEQRVEQLTRTFPAGVKVAYPYDTTPVVNASVEQVSKTLLEAVVLVFLVMFLFLQNFRATLIPTIAVPVVLLGTLGILAVFGYSINTLTLFGMVLAIGLLVDDAIVVVENVERLMAEEGLSPLEATRKSMREISGALVGIGLVLSAVFVPMAFFPGSTGVIYRQFSITIVSAMGLSVLVALVLTPALCATLLKPVEKGSHGKTTGFFGWFNRTFDKGAVKYEKGVTRAISSTKRSAFLYAVLVLIMGLAFTRLPSGFLPDEDQGIVLTVVQMPAGASLARTQATTDQLMNHLLTAEKDSVAEVYAMAGFSGAGNGQNSGQIFVRLHPWHKRKGDDQSAAAVAARINTYAAKLRDATAIAFTPPAVIELGNASGFEFRLTDVGGIGHEKLLAARNELLAMASKHPALAAVRANGVEDMPQLQIDIDQAAAGAHGLSQSDINDTLSTAWGGAYVNDFIDRGRVKKVFVQADAPYRDSPDDLAHWHVRGASGEMAPFSVFGNSRWDFGPARLERFDGNAAFQILGQAASGHSSGEAMAAMEDLASKLPDGVGFKWSGISYEERLAGNQALALYALSLLFVFLCLAALYESWSVPLAVLTAAPLGALGAVIAATVFGLDNDVFFQVGLLTTIGVSAKNAILIVEFAEAERRAGRPVIEAAIHAAKLRLRPILMTSLAFIGGIIPLAASSGAGAGGQNAIGIGVIGGMVAATMLGIIFVPLFFVIVNRLFHRKSARLRTEQFMLEPAE